MVDALEDLRNFRRSLAIAEEEVAVDGVAAIRLAGLRRRLTVAMGLWQVVAGGSRPFSPAQTSLLRQETVVLAADFHDVVEGDPVAITSPELAATIRDMVDSILDLIPLLNDAGETA